MDSATIDDLMEILSDTRSRISSIVGAWYERDEPRDYETKSWRNWSIAIGTLACDVGEAAAQAGASGSLRAAEILTRSIFEYYARLAYYEAFPTKSVAFNREAAEVMRKLAGQRLKHVKEPLPDDLRAWIETQTTVTPQQLRNMLEDMLRAVGSSKEHARQFIDEMYFGFYYVSSFIAHGSQGSLLDVLDMVGAEADDRIWVQHMPTRPEVLRVPTLYRLTHILIRLMQVLERMHGDQPLIADELLERLFQLHQAALDAANDYAKDRPPYLARLRTTGV